MLGAASAAAPPLDPLAAQAAHCWAFCGRTWAPERWPIYATFYAVPDWHLLIDAMRGLRDGN